MTSNDMQAEIAEELACTLRSEAGSRQNELRMQYQVRKARSLGSRRRVAVSAAAVMDQAIQSVRQHYPNFEPVVPPDAMTTPR